MVGAGTTGLSADSVARAAAQSHKIRRLRATLCLLGVRKLARSVARAARAYLARRASLSESEISTLLPSRRIQPR